jgi:lipoprotein-anchoring transpeptidase ErfK/SrfK
MSSNNYKIEVSVIEQKVLVYKYNKLIKSMICSTGIEGKSTPEGFFYTNGKGEYFYNTKYGEGAFYWINFLNNIYLFHSIPVDIKNQIIQSEATKLGEKASHGCIRLSLEDSKWLYDTVPCYDTLVYIH